MFIDAWVRNRTVMVTTASGNGSGPVVHRFPVRPVAIVADPNGDFVTFDGTRVKRILYRTHRAHARAAKRKSRLDWEGDIDPALVVLEREFAHSEPARPFRAFVDIEVDVDPERGFATPDDPHAPVVSFAVSVPGGTTGVLLCPPGSRSGDVALSVGERFLVVEDEKELLSILVDSVIGASDVWCGWNSSFFDLPYLVRRLERLDLAELTTRLSVAGERPVERTVEKWGTKRLTYETRGRVHLDYLDLYRRFVRREMHSYALEHVAREETGEGKVAYTGSLGELWRCDPGKFAEYNLRDVELLEAIESRHRLVDLAVGLAHEARVPLRAVLGTVALVENAIILEAHGRGYVVPRRKWYMDTGDEEVRSDTDVSGAAVFEPKTGIHELVGCIDVNSLYPSVIRTLNASPETVVGQLDLSRTRRTIEEKMASGMSLTTATADLFGTVEYRLVAERSKESVVLYTVGLPPWLDPGRHEMPARDLAEIVFDPEIPLSISAYGTLFRTDVEGVVPGLLHRWYEERKRMQKAARTWRRLEEGIPLPDDLAAELAARLANGVPSTGV